MEGPQTKILAEQLEAVLAGQVVEHLLVPEGRWQANVMLLHCTGQVIQRVRTHGSWLLLDFSHGVTWMCQLLARSTWRTTLALHLCRDGATRWVDSEDAASRCDGAKQAHKSSSSSSRPLLTLTLRDGTVATLTGRPLFLIASTELVPQLAPLRESGPDPLSESFAAEDLQFRLRQASARTVASALLDERVISGIGNALKCEILFAARLPPAARIASLYASQLQAVAVAAVLVARRSYAHLVKDPAADPPYQVYDRAGEPCPVCGGEITTDRSGSDAHWTWYCPVCQQPEQKPTLFT